MLTIDFTYETDLVEEIENFMVTNSFDNYEIVEDNGAGNAVVTFW